MTIPIHTTTHDGRAAIVLDLACVDMLIGCTYAAQPADDPTWDELLLDWLAIQHDIELRDRPIAIELRNDAQLMFINMQ